MLDFDGMKIGYVPYSQDLQHPGDRRRIDILSDFVDIEIQVKNLTGIDVLVLSNSSNFSKYLRKYDCPIVIDLVDAYLAERPSFLKDFGRNFLRSINGTSSLRFLRYTSHLRYACQNADAVVVATIEQSRFIEGLNTNVHIIIDDQSEMLLEEDTYAGKSSEKKEYIFWEGLGYTLKHFRSISTELENFLLANNFYLKLLTNIKFHQWGGFLGTTYTENLVKDIFPRAWKNIEIIPWSIEATKEAARSSVIGIIPISKDDNFAMFKPENKLISMWSMGLPVLCSPTKAYSRVVEEINASNSLCHDNWQESLSFLVKNPSIREDLIRAGMNYYESYCTREKLQVKWLAAIDSVLIE
jgi:hypothetical protein